MGSSGINASTWGVLSATTKMKVLIAILVLAVALCETRKCYECNEGSGLECGRVVPGGSLDIKQKTCPGGKNFCKLMSLNGKITERNCSDLMDFPADYEPVAGDTNKRCRKTRGNAQKDCLCNSDLCNIDTMASPNTSNPSTIASITLLTSLLFAKAIFM